MKKNIIIMSITTLLIFLVSIAWGSFSRSLYITGEASILPDTTPPTCGEWKLRPASLTYQEATSQNAFINPATNNTWTQDSLILSVDCSDDTSCIADHYDVKTYNTTIKTESAVLSQVIEDVVEHSTTCTLPVGGSNPYVDKDAPEIDTLTITPLDGEFKILLELKDGGDGILPFTNIDGAYYTYEGKSFIGTGVENVIISETIPTLSEYATAAGTDNGEGANPRYTFANSRAANKAAEYCTGCRLMTRSEAIAWDSAAGTGESTKRIGKWNGTAYFWWVSDAFTETYVYGVLQNGKVAATQYYIASSGVRPVVSISSNMTMSGSGTQVDPYVITSNTRQSGLVSTQFYYKKCSDNNWTALTKDTFNATVSKSYTDWYIPSNGTSSTSCLASSWGTYHFKVDVEDAVGNTKTYYNTGTSGVTDNVNNMTQFALLPPDAEHITYSNNSTNCTELSCILDELRYMFGLSEMKYTITLDKQGGTSGSSSIYENYGDGFYLTNNNGTLSNKITTSANNITVPTKTGYIFGGYYTSPNGAGTKFIDENGNLTVVASATLQKSSRKLYAYWTNGPGLYDDNNNLVKSWAELEELGLTKEVIEYNYTSPNVRYVEGSPYQIFTNNNLEGHLVLPTTITKIGRDAFGYIETLKSVTMQYGVTSISVGSFFRCSGLTSVKLPSTVTSIGNEAFAYDSIIESIVVDQNNTTYDSRNNSNAIIETATNKMVLGCKNTVIPNTVIEIGNVAFEGSDITSITIPNSVKTIGANAFYWCDNLTSITIPASVTSIGTSAFAACKNLASISVNSNNTVYDSRNNCNAIIEKATNTLIVGCKNTVIPNNVTRIGEDAFYGATSLTSITIPASVTSIGMYSFAGVGITSITIPANVNFIGTNAFYGSNLSSATFASPNNWFVSTNYDATSGTNLTLTNTSQNATYLKNTYRYFYWRKSS